MKKLVCPFKKQFANDDKILDLALKSWLKFFNEPLEIVIVGPDEPHISVKHEYLFSLQRRNWSRYSHTWRHFLKFVETYDCDEFIMIHNDFILIRKTDINHVVNKCPIMYTRKEFEKLSTYEYFGRLHDTLKRCEELFNYKYEYVYDFHSPALISKKDVIKLIKLFDYDNLHLFHVSYILYLESQGYEIIDKENRITNLRTQELYDKFMNDELTSAHLIHVPSCFRKDSFFKKIERIIGG